MLLLCYFAPEGQAMAFGPCNIHEHYATLAFSWVKYRPLENAFYNISNPRFRNTVQWGLVMNSHILVLVLLGLSL